ncbi:hypothetical protein C8J57DRAFT_1535467 [Mycena rebaudengoi]|nr:hypothetical protein C8J57DRAFT_1535467 [Mycena rebaudengoi]
MASASKTPPPPTRLSFGAVRQRVPWGQRRRDVGQRPCGKPIGVNAYLGLTTNMGRQAAAGRNCEGFGANPFFPVATPATINGICITHGQEHLRGGSETSHIYSSNIDDKTFHEVCFTPLASHVRSLIPRLISSFLLYLWPLAEAVHLGVVSVMCAYNKINQTQV